MKNKWQCEICYHKFNLKRELIQHLIIEQQEAEDDANTAEGQLEELGVDDF